MTRAQPVADRLEHMLAILTDQVFPDTTIESEALSRAGITLRILTSSQPETIRAEAGGAHAVLTTYAPIDAQTIYALKACRIIARYGAGVDNVDLEAARSRGIVVTNVPDYCVEEVADHTMALLLAAVRKVVAGNHAVRNGAWGIDHIAPVRRLRGRSLGLVGYGRIGTAVAARAHPFGLSVMAYDPLVDRARFRADNVAPADSLPQLLSRSDIVSIHVPLTPDTLGLIDAEAIEHARPGSILINTARGPVCSLDAVLRALQSGRLAAACLDVFESEPPEPSLFSDTENLIMTPHMAFYSKEAIQESQAKAAAEIIAVLTGQEPKYRVI